MRKPIELLNAHFDGEELTEQEAHELRRWIVADSSAAQTVVELGVIHSQTDYWLSVPRFLDELGDTDDLSVKQSIESAIETIQIESHRSQRKPREARPAARWVGTVAMIAASLLVAVTWWNRGEDEAAETMVAVVEPTLPATPPPAPVLATVSESFGARLADGSWLRRGQQFRAGDRLDLTQGILALTTSVGNEVVVESPSTFVVRGPLDIELTSGRLAARVEREGRGLAIATPTARVVDLGTEFGVGVGPDLETEVAVYEGVVELYGLANSPDGSAARSKRITAGRSGYVDASGGLVWSVQTLATNRGFIRPDEIASLRNARDGSPEGWQQVSFYSLQRVPGLVAFQSFDAPSGGAGYSVSFDESSIRSEGGYQFAGDLSDRHLYTSGSLEVGPDQAVFLDLDTSSDSRLARAGLLTDRGQVGRSGSELWLSWKTRVVDPDIAGDHAGLSLMFGDQRLLQEPVFVGQANSHGDMKIRSNIGSRWMEIDLDSDPTSYTVETMSLGGETHQWYAQLIFSERGDKVAVWCDVPVEDLRDLRPQAEFVNANVMFDRIRLGVSRESSPWRFDDITLATSLTSLAKSQAVLEQTRAMAESGAPRR